jgi:enamine deaminase RidA (YjgF/YER057c/UK114 family)
MAVITPSNPAGVAVPMVRYSQAVMVEKARRRLVISGQVGKAADDMVPSSGDAQIALAFSNLLTILHAHGMDATNVVKSTTFLVDRNLINHYREARDAFFAEHAAASTLLIVSGLADPRFVVEIEAEAAD